MDLLPDFDTFARQWRAGKNQTVRTSVVSDLETPVSAMLKLGMGRPYSFLLESMEGGAVRGRYSIIGREPDLIWRCERGGRVSINRDVLRGATHFTPCSRAPMDDLRALLEECRIDSPDQPQPMAAGLFGYLGYDTVRYMERLPEAKSEGVDVPEAVLIRPTLLAIFDQIENKFALVTPAWFDSAETPEAAYERARAVLARALADLRRATPETSPRSSAAGPELSPVPEPHRATGSAPPHSNMTEQNYCAMVEKAKRYIRAGDIFQVVLSQRFAMPFSRHPLDLYRAVRRLDPSPFLFFFDFGDFAVVGSSPEILVRVRDGKITIRPIAGTRPRGQGNQSDGELKAELLADPKELSEHLMLLDLGRNDVGRFAKTGTVKVTARNTIEYYRHVMHIVSNVEGELDPRHTPLGALMGGFPAGTVSGAPKIRAIEIIDELEPDHRGVYAGCIGYFGANGTMDTCIAIRTAVIKDGMMHVQAGAGIVYDSNPQAEYRECVAKARGLLKAAEEALGQNEAF
ncbi:MAG: anthranilate synthase component I [Pseudomonadota bacterium]|nr:anthranilate synthase component I [Pseudomonadota bacterium]